VRTRNLSVICAITPDEIILLQCFKGGMAASDFAGFLSRLLINNREIKENLDDYVIILDNSRIHNAKEIKKFMSYLPIQFLSPYSPFLNPIEEFFQIWKGEFRKRYCKSLRQVLENPYNLFKRIKYAFLPKLFMHSLSFYPRCLNKLPILP